MKADRVVRDGNQSLLRVLEALDHNLTARDNFGPEGQEGWVLTSRGPDHVPEYRPVTLSPDSTIDWSAITGTPNNLAGYGIEDAYTILQVNNLLAAQTHPAEDIVSGILDPSRLGSGVSGAGTFLRGDSTWQPLSLSGLGLSSEVGSLAGAFQLVDHPHEDWPAWLPGPKGDTGAPGAPGAPGGGGTSIMQQLIHEEHYEESGYLHGPAEQRVVAGPTIIQQMFFEDAVEPWHYPNGPSAAAAASSGGSIDGVGVAGRHAYWTDVDTLTASSIAEFGVGDVQFLSELGDVTFGFVPGYVAPATHSGWEFHVDTADYDFRLRSRDTGNTVMRFADDESGVEFAGGGVVFATIAKGIVQIEPFDGVNEGGEVQFLGAGAAADWTLDNFQGRMRFHTGGTSYVDMNQTRFAIIGGAMLEVSGGDSTTTILARVAAHNFQWRSNDDGTGTQQDATRPSWAVSLGEGATDNFIVYRRPAAGAYAPTWAISSGHHWVPQADATKDIGGGANRVRTLYAQGVSDGATAAGMILTTSGVIVMHGSGSNWTQQNFYTGGVARWHVVSGGHWYPVADNAYDIGQSASLLRVRDIWVAGEVVGLNGGGSKTADQAAFANVQTNITGGSFAVGTNESWIADIFIPITMVGATGVKFYFTGPAGAVGSVTMVGTGAALTTVESVYTAAITVPGTFLHRIAGAGWINVRAELRSVGTAGTFQLVGITAGAAITCTVKRGFTMDARRLS